MTEIPSAAIRSHWIEHARDGVEGGEAPDARALAILEASQNLAPLARSQAEKESLARLTRAALRMASVRDDDLRRRDILVDVTRAWKAFTHAWESEVSDA